MCDLDPLAVILVSSGSRGDRLLFRHPFETDECKETTIKCPGKNPYALSITEDYEQKRSSQASSIANGTLTGYSDKILANLLAVKADLCGKRFEVKINDVTFVGSPMLLHPKNQVQPSPKREAPTMISFNVVFVLRAFVDESLVHCYQDLAKQLAVALRHEEKRTGYLNAQKSCMLAIHDEVATLPEDSLESPFRLMLGKCQLAMQLKAVYDSLCNTGVVQLYINKWVHINFCLPHKVHNLHMPSDSLHRVQPEGVQRCLAALRPYHTMLLLTDETSLLECLPMDASPSLTRLIKVANPRENLASLASDSDLALGQVFRLASHLVYWGKATIIYPLCETSVYMLAPNTNTYVNSLLVEQFSQQFPGISLPALMSSFSLPTPLGEQRDFLGLPHQQAQQVQMVVWMLKHRLLVQVHTYVFLLPALGATTLRTASSSSSEGPLTRHSFSHFLTPEESLGMNTASSTSDLISVVSDGSPSQVTYSTFSTKSPSVEVASDGMVITEETRAHRRLQDSLLSQLSATERQSVQSCVAANNPDDLKLFARLCPYFNGKHHLEEMMYFENVRRSQLLALLDKFRDVLITCQHEDPGTTVWINR